ncbi:MAG: UDP-2,4-diacetamido-2,4,6-trideoxy-beta-L-altropyranose hydrolase [Candidatus Omnitrophica bacterium]|nr:UDP-2,4-diacetamido-2,4,6-trideoxy-beta-L-altropyranose hydrolase [Candidatus Omnitrophota bacterium]
MGAGFGSIVMTAGYHRKVLIRVDASPVIGLGHLMRMLALGQLLFDAGYEIHYATLTEDPLLRARLAREGFDVHVLPQAGAWDAASDVEALLHLSGQIKPAWVVLDGYHFDADYEARIKRSGVRLLRVDDTPGHRYYADAVLNQNYGAERMTYSVEPTARVLAGLNYVLLRREFRQAARLVRQGNVDGPFRILVSLGGAQVAQALNRRLAAGFAGMEDRNLSLVLAVSRGQTDGLISGGIVEVRVDTGDMAREMYQADIAVVSGGTTMWELVCMNVPFLAVALNEAQRDYLPLLSADGLCVNLGFYQDILFDHVCQAVLALRQDRERREQMVLNYRRILNRERIGQDLLSFLEQGGSMTV